MAKTAPTTPDSVKAVYADVLPHQDVQLDMAITTANMMVQTVIVDSGCGANYSDEQLEAIQRYLAAALFQQNVGIITSKSVGQASESYQFSSDYYLKSTLQGQTAMLLDTNQCLSQLIADTELAIQGKKSFVPSVVSLHSNKQRGLSRYGC